mmetsp:Transcript_70592/g.124572  ORF Transcript_70592/g.124572 Transcript_70592/m.124572 type:complete len:317 (-) Transcript_70592:132-1082(-)
MAFFSDLSLVEFEGDRNPKCLIDGILSTLLEVHELGETFLKIFENLLIESLHSPQLHVVLESLDFARCHCFVDLYQQLLLCNNLLGALDDRWIHLGCFRVRNGMLNGLHFASLNCSLQLFLHLGAHQSYLGRLKLIFFKTKFACGFKFAWESIQEDLMTPACQCHSQGLADHLLLLQEVHSQRDLSHERCVQLPCWLAVHSGPAQRPSMLLETPQVFARHGLENSFLRMTIRLNPVVEVQCSLQLSPLDSCTLGLLQSSPQLGWTVHDRSDVWRSTGNGSAEQPPACFRFAGHDTQHDLHSHNKAWINPIVLRFFD